MADAPAMEASTPKSEGTSRTVEGESPPHTDPSPDQDMGTDTENVIREDKEDIRPGPGRPRITQEVGLSESFVMQSSSSAIWGSEVQGLGAGVHRPDLEGQTGLGLLNS